MATPIGELAFPSAVSELPRLTCGGDQNRPAPAICERNFLRSGQGTASIGISPSSPSRVDLSTIKLERTARYSRRANAPEVSRDQVSGWRTVESWALLLERNVDAPECEV